MDFNLTGNLWGMPLNLMGQIETKKPDQLSIGLIDVIFIIVSIIFIGFVLKYKVIPLFGEFWHHQGPQSLSEHEGERFIFRKRNNEFIEYKPTHDRGFWRNYLIIYEEILSPLRKNIASQKRLANWMFAISGGAIVLLVSNFDKFQMAKLRINFENILLYEIPDKTLFLFLLLTLFISAGLHFLSNLHLYYLESELEDMLAYIPLPVGIRDLDSANRNIENLRRNLESMNEANIPTEYSALVSRFENKEKSLDVRRVDIWRRFQIGNAFFMVSLASLIVFYISYIIYS